MSGDKRLTELSESLKNPLKNRSRKKEALIEINNDKLHLIAINNLDDPEYVLRRWWHLKYRIPPKDIDDYTFEELYVEYLEDRYIDHPKEKQNFLDSIDPEVADWDGTMSAEYEESVKSFHEKHKIDLSEFQSDIEMSEEEEEEMLKNLGRNLPGSTHVVGSDIEFEDEF